eukprot:6475743-Amphidinium_carterae.1
MSSTHFGSCAFEANILSNCSRTTKSLPLECDKSQGRVIYFGVDGAAHTKTHTGSSAAIIACFAFNVGLGAQHRLSMVKADQRIRVETMLAVSCTPSMLFRSEGARNNLPACLKRGLIPQR